MYKRPRRLFFFPRLPWVPRGPLCLFGSFVFFVVPRSVARRLRRGTSTARAGRLGDFTVLFASRVKPPVRSARIPAATHRGSAHQARARLPFSSTAGRVRHDTPIA